jgi:uncharacterized protein YjbI with pentapeptide repeats
VVPHNSRNEGPSESSARLSAVSPLSDDRESLRKAVEDTAAIGGGLWLSYLFVLFYLGIAAGAITHTDLLLQNPVKLPFLNIELPLLAFFVLAPLLFLIVHAYTLVNLVLLAGRVAQFNEALSDGISEDDAARRRRLPSNIFVQFLGAPEEERYSSFGLLVAAILWVMLVIAPIALVLLLQIQFLPYHSQWITWISRIVLILDLCLLWWLWGGILDKRSQPKRARLWKRWTKLTASGLLTAGLTLFACAVLTTPGEWQGDHLPSLTIIPTERGLVSLHTWLLSNELIPGSDRPSSLFHNTLILLHFNLYEALKIDEPQKMVWRKYLINLHNRDLRGALLLNAILTKADLSDAQLQGAELSGAELQGVSFHSAQLQGAKLDGAQLQGASFLGAQLQGAVLSLSLLHGAKFPEAHLQGAELIRADLKGADLSGAYLQGAELYRAQLQGADLSYTQLEGARLEDAQLQGAVLYHAELQGASLEHANLQGASLEGAIVWRAQLRDVSARDLFAPAGSPDWNPDTYADWVELRSWTDEIYANQRKLIEQVPEGYYRREALHRVAILDCLKNSTLASCDYSTEPPKVVSEWKHVIEAASIDKPAYAKAFATILGDLVCSNDAAYGLGVLRGLVREDPGLPAHPGLGARYIRGLGSEETGHSALVMRFTSADTVGRPDRPLRGGQQKLSSIVECLTFGTALTPRRLRVNPPAKETGLICAPLRDSVLKSATIKLP